MLIRSASSQAIIPNTWEGKRLSLHSSSLGEVLMAWKEEQELDRILKSIDFVTKTPKTITDPQIFREELKLVAQRGWASDDGEDVVGVRCIAAPVRDSSGKVVGGVSIVGHGLATVAAGSGALVGFPDGKGRRDVGRPWLQGSLLTACR